MSCDTMRCKVIEPFTLLRVRDPHDHALAHYLQDSVPDRGGAVGPPRAATADLASTSRVHVHAYYP